MLQTSEPAARGAGQVRWDFKVHALCHMHRGQELLPALPHLANFSFFFNFPETSIHYMQTGSNNLSFPGYCSYGMT